jgi:hypothetical protein
MKKVLFVLGQLVLFVLFLAILFGGPFFGLLHLDVLHLGSMKWFVSHPTLTTTRFFAPIGYLYATLLFAVVLAIEAAARKIRTAGLWTTIVFVLAFVLALASKCGWASPSL